MSSSVFFLILAAALFHATWNIIVKGGDNKLFEIAINALGAGIGALGLLFFTELPGVACLPMLALSCLSHIVYYLAMAKAYKSGDMMLVYTVMRGCAPVFTALAMTFMGHPLAWRGWAGILLLCCGILSLATDNKSQGKKGRAIFHACLCSFVIMTYTLADGLGARASVSSLSYTCWLYIVNMLPIQIWVLARSGKNYLRYLRKRAPIGIPGGFCGLASYGIAIWAMTKAPIALVGALRETSVIFGMVLAIFFLGEKLTPARAMAALLVTCGAMLARLD